MIITRRTYDTVALINKRVGALDHIIARIMLLRRKISFRRRLIRIDIPNRQTTEQRHNGMSVRIKENRR